MRMYEAEPGHWIPEGQTLDSMYQGDAMFDQIYQVTGEFPGDELFGDGGDHGYQWMVNRIGRMIGFPFSDELDEQYDPEPPARVWTTAEGQQIPFEELEDRHLLNIIKLLRRRADLAFMHYLTHTRGPSGDMASMAFEEEMGRLTDATDHELAQWLWPHSYRPLFVQAVTRGLEVPEPMTPEQQFSTWNRVRS